MKKTQKVLDCLKYIDNQDLTQLEADRLVYELEMINFNRRNDDN